MIRQNYKKGLQDIKALMDDGTKEGRSAHDVLWSIEGVIARFGFSKGKRS